MTFKSMPIINITGMVRGRVLWNYLTLKFIPWNIFSTKMSRFVVCIHVPLCIHVIVLILYVPAVSFHSHHSSSRRGSGSRSHSRSSSPVGTGKSERDKYGSHGHSHSSKSSGYERNKEKDSSAWHSKSADHTTPSRRGMYRCCTYTNK